MEIMERIDQLSPRDAHAALGQTSDSALVDVRTRAEWTFVGVPDLTAIRRPQAAVEWVRFPDMQPNDRFIEELTAELGGKLPQHLFFICRSGARSLAAARLVADRARGEGWSVTCVNVAEGFEGDLDAEGHRGTVNGWKVAGLPWRQG